MVKVHIVFHSLYTHVYQLAEAMAKGARSVAGTEVVLTQVKETMSDDVLTKMGALDAKKAFAHIPIADSKALAEADAIVLGSPTRFGLPTAQMQAFIDTTGGLWAKGALIGKLGSAFTSTGSQHGGQETTITHMHTFFYHHGMVVTGVPYSCKELSNVGEMSGGSPYGSSTIAGGDGSRQPSANELAIAEFQGKHIAELAAKLAK